MLASNLINILAILVAHASTCNATAFVSRKTRSLKDISEFLVESEMTTQYEKPGSSMLQLLNKIEQEDRFDLDALALPSFVGDDEIRGRLEGLLDKETPYHSDTFYLSMSTTIEHRYNAIDDDFLGVLNRVPATSDNNKRASLSESPSYRSYTDDSNEIVGLIGLSEGGDSFIVKMKTAELIEETPEYKKQDYIPLLDMITQTSRFETRAYALPRSEFTKHPEYIGRLQGKLPDDGFNKYETLKYSWADKVDNKIGALHGEGGSTGTGGLSPAFVTVMDIVPISGTNGTPEGIVIRLDQDNDMLMLNNFDTSAPTATLSSRPTMYPTPAPVSTTEAPTSSPTNSPTDQPSPYPTSTPTEKFSYNPTESPTTAPPSSSPTDVVTSAPSYYPSIGASDAPTQPLMSNSYDPTPSPTVTPTSAPSDELIPSPTAAPTASCHDMNKQFFLKKNPDDKTKGVFKKCEWLSKKDDDFIENICKRTKSFKGRGPAREVCPETCGVCDETQSPSDSATSSPSSSPTKFTVTSTSSPTASPTASPTTSPTASPTTSPTASPTVSPTDLPTLSPTTSPTSSPTRPPATAAPTASCHDMNKRFFLKKNPDDKTQGVFKKCEWLSNKNEEFIQNICKRTKKFGGKGPAREVCPETCGVCDETQSPSDSATSSPTASPTASPTTSPTASLTLSLTTSPTASPTISPTTSPTASPVAVNGDSSPSCQDKSNRKFFLKLDPDDKTKGIFKKCEWLRKKDEEFIQNICKRTKKFDGKGPAQAVCPETCGKCASNPSPSTAPSTADISSTSSAADPTNISCDEEAGSKFFFRVNKNNNTPTYKKCSWLSGMDAARKQTICQKVDSFDGVGPAKEVCPQTCGMCESSRRRTFLRH